MSQLCTLGCRLSVRVETSASKQLTSPALRFFENLGKPWFVNVKKEEKKINEKEVSQIVSFNWSLNHRWLFEDGKLLFESGRGTCWSRLPPWKTYPTWPKLGGTGEEKKLYWRYLPSLVPGSFGGLGFRCLSCISRRWCQQGNNRSLLNKKSRFIFYQSNM